MDLTKTSFTISNIPVPLFKWFKQFCLDNTGDSYSMGIAQLKLYYDFFCAYYPNLLSVMEKVEELENKIDNKQKINEEPKKILTFG